MAVSIHNLDEEYVSELATIELAYHIFKEAKNSLHFNQLAEEIKEIKKIDGERLYDILSQLYTELNLDGRFLHLGKNEWALKSWYSVATAYELLKVPELDEDEEDDDFVEELDDEPIILAIGKKKKIYDADEVIDDEDVDLEELSTDDDKFSDDEDLDDEPDEDLDVDLGDLVDEDLDYEDLDEDENTEDESYYIDE